MRSNPPHPLEPIREVAPVRDFLDEERVQPGLQAIPGLLAVGDRRADAGRPGLIRAEADDAGLYRQRHVRLLAYRDAGHEGSDPARRLIEGEWDARAGWIGLKVVGAERGGHCPGGEPAFLSR